MNARTCAPWLLISIFCVCAPACSDDNSLPQPPIATSGGAQAGVTSTNGSDTNGVTGSSATNGSSTTTGGSTTAGVTGSTGIGSVNTASIGGVSTGTATGAAMTTTSGGLATNGTTGAGGAATSTASVTSTTGSTIPNEGDRSAEGVCARWNADRANMDEGTWSGNIQTCDPGDISADGRENALRIFNLYRWLADLPSVTTEAERNQQAQACALMMDANNSLSHEPPTSWTCYTELGAQGARTSNISSGPGVSSVDAYLLDTGNESTHGHRRIILSNWLGPIGLGSTGPGGSSCMQNIGGTGDAGKAWVAWPPAGVFPIQAYSPGRSSLSQTGWSIQSEDMNLSGAQVMVTSGGTQLAMDVSSLTGNYGSTSGIRLVPNGWDVEAGQTYSVSVTGIDSPINYDVQIVDCQ